MELLNQEIIKFNKICRRIELYATTDMKPILDKVYNKTSLTNEEQLIYIQFTDLLTTNKTIENNLKDARELAMNIKRGYLGIVNDILPDVITVYDLETKCI